MTRAVLAVLAISCAMLSAMAQESSANSSMADMPGMDHAVTAMSGHHMDMGPHMKMTALRALQPGDQQRADAVASEARKVLARYTDYNVALKDGYRIFLPNVPQKQYHFTNYRYAFEARIDFNPDRPTSLLYEKTSDGGYKLIGAMYTAPKSFSEEQLNARVPLSVAQWHEHVNFCQAPKGRESEYFGQDAKFGLRGSVATQKECETAGGTFRPVIFGWMVHVYPFEKNEADVWSVERQMDHGD